MTTESVLEFSGTCDVCGNAYDKVLEIRRGDHSGVFDSFECAIRAFAPICAHCGCTVIGHGVESDGVMFCCAHCARVRGEDGMIDRA